MPAGSADLSYRRAAVQEASPEGLMVILYDMLVEDLQRAVAAVQHSAIADRSRQLKHALLVLQLLEGSLDMQQGGAAARSLSAFYTYLRRAILDAQFGSNEEILSRLIDLILDVREAWRTADATSANGSGPYPAVRPIRDLDGVSAEPSRWSA